MIPVQKNLDIYEERGNEFSGTDCRLPSKSEHAHATAAMQTSIAKREDYTAWQIPGMPRAYRFVF